MTTNEAANPAGAPGAQDAQSAGQPLLFDNRIEPNGLGLLELDQVAAMLGKAPGTVTNMVARREIPFLRLGRRNVFLRDSLVEWLKEKEVKPYGSYRKEKKR